MAEYDEDSLRRELVQLRDYITVTGAALQAAKDRLVMLSGLLEAPAVGQSASERQGQVRS